MVQKSLVLRKVDDLSIERNPNKELWSEFVFSHPNANIFQTPEMAEVYKRTRNYEPITLAVIDESDEIIALMLAVIIKEGGSIIGSFSARSIIFGGPLFIENDLGFAALKELLTEYEKIIKKKAIYSEIRNVHDVSQFRFLFENSGFVFEDHLNFLLELNKPREEIWGQISRSMRKNINRAIKQGVTIEELDDRSLIPEFYRFLKEVYHEAKIPLPDISLFYSIFDILVPKGMAKFHLARYNKEYVGGRLSLMYKQTIYADFVGVSKKFKKLHANPLLNWHVISWGMENGYQIFDFGGAGKPDKNYGVREFKRQFGGKLVNFGRFCRTHSPIKRQIAEKGFAIYRRFFT